MSSLLGALRIVKKDTLAGRTVEHLVTLQYIIKMLGRDAHETSLADTIDNADNSLAVSADAKHVIPS